MSGRRQYSQQLRPSAVEAIVRAAILLTPAGSYIPGQVLMVGVACSVT